MNRTWRLMAHLVVVAAASVLPSVSSRADVRQYVICIDPGHPSEVGSGTQGRHITEIEAAWQVAQRLKTELQARGMRVVLTKKKEHEFVRNRRRAEIANQNHADYMVRLHCDSDAGTGIASYAPDQQGSIDGVTGPSKGVIKASRKMGAEFHRTMVKSLDGRLKDRGFLPDTSTAVGRKHHALIGSIFSKSPVVLVEMCVLTNPKDEQFMRDPKNQTLLAKAMADGVQAALATNQKAEPAPNVSP